MYSTRLAHRINRLIYLNFKLMMHYMCLYRLVAICPLLAPLLFSLQSFTMNQYPSFSEFNPLVSLKTITLYIFLLQTR